MLNSKTVAWTYGGVIGGFQVALGFTVPLGFGLVLQLYAFTFLSRYPPITVAKIAIVTSAIQVLPDLFSPWFAILTAELKASWLAHLPTEIIYFGTILIVFGVLVLISLIGYLVGRVKPAPIVF